MGAMRHAEKIAALRERVLNGPGVVDPSIRAAAFEGTGVPDDLAAYVDKVVNHAYKVTDSDVERLKAAGYSEDAIFEITVAAALGAGVRRYEAGVKAMQ
jgi:alkylhydroperoxidase family enzyme